MSCRRALVVLSTVLVIALSGCGGSEVSSTPLDDTYTPASSAKDAVEDLLSAEETNDRATSFKLLTPDSRNSYKDVADWTARRNQLPVITSFEIESTNDSEVVATVHHTPGLDPFKGLSAKNERQTWTATEFKGGWLLGADPKIELILPSEDKIAPAVKAWAEAVQACDQQKAVSLQAIDPVLTATSSTIPTLCKVGGEITLDRPGGLSEGPESASIIAQYSTDALDWARSVEITAPVDLHVVVAPLGDDWKVVALY